MIHRRRHDAGSGEGAADESAAGAAAAGGEHAAATAVAEHALVLVPVRRLQSVPPVEIC